MDNPHFSTEHRKGQHLTAEERHDIEVHLKDEWSKYKIAKHLNRPYNTVKNEIKRGTVSLYHGKVFRYKADAGQQQYLENRRSSARKYRYLETSEFLSFVAKQFREQGWSLDACVGNALLTGQFSRKEIVCTKTLYNYVDLGILSIRNIAFPKNCVGIQKHARCGNTAGI
ncbi:MAG: helix-turn-helix domain-containing protein [Bacteroidales bacterium]|nr:helix-turn-helix domain-containing protein [Bacteroidales bacterium]